MPAPTSPQSRPPLSRNSSLSPPRFALPLSGSRPILGLLNPSGRHYTGYSRVDEEDEGDLELGQSRRPPEESDDDSEDGGPPRSILVEADGAGPSTTRHPSPEPDQDLTPSPSIMRSPPRSAPSRAPPVQTGRPLDCAPPRTTRLSKGKERAQPAHAGGGLGPGPPRSTRGTTGMTGGLSEYERALWIWVNVQDLDGFLQQVYAYYVGKGIYCIALSRILNLLTVGFVIAFSTFLLRCVDYSSIKHDGSLSEVLVPHCVSGFSGGTLFFFLAFGAFYVWQIASFAFSFRALLDMYRFYTHLLGIPDADVQTISWQEVVQRIGRIRDSNPLTSLSSSTAGPSTTKLDAHDIANRIMRQENYLIALFNKDLLKLRLPVPPPVAGRLPAVLGGRQGVLTRVLEWNMSFALLGYVFDGRGQVRKQFVRGAHRERLVEELRRRFIFMGILNAIFAPFVVVFLLIYSFFRYFEEYHKNPSTIGSRQYTQFARWKFREFNELPHLFQRRLDSSHPIAQKYIEQFPNERVALIMRFVAFIAGSFAAVLLLASVLDPDLFLHFEITPQRTVLFYIGVFGSILAIARGMIPDENQVFDPEHLLRGVIHWTHYLPTEWKGMLHSQYVHREFGRLFEMKVTIFVQELLSVICTPWILWLSLPDCAPAVIDFIRQSTVHVEGLGYICSFAHFDFARHGNVKFGAPTDATDPRFQSEGGKLEKSILNFKATHPDWNPTDPAGSLFLSRMTDVNASVYPNNGRRVPPATSTASPVLNPADRANYYDRAFQRSVTRGASAGRARPVTVPDERGLGEDYVADVKGRSKQGEDDMDEEEGTALRDEGVLGLLGQIYDQRRW